MTKRVSKIAALAVVAVVVFIAGAIVAAHHYTHSETFARKTRAQISKKLASRLNYFELGDYFHVDWRGVVTVGPLLIGGKKNPLLYAERVALTPAYVSLFSRPRAAQVELSQVQIYTDFKAARLRSLLKKKNGEPAAAAEYEAPPALRISDARVQLPARFGQNRRATIKQMDLRYLRTDSGGSLRGEIVSGSDSEFSFEAAQQSPEEWAFFLRAESLSLQKLVSEFSPALSANLIGGITKGEIRVRYDINKRQAMMLVQGSVTELSVNNAQLAATLVGPVRSQADAAISINFNSGAVRINDAHFYFGDDNDVHLSFYGDAYLGRQGFFTFDAFANHIDCGKAVFSLPLALQPRDEVPTPRGFLSGWLRLSGPWRRPKEWEVQGDLNLAGLRKSPQPHRVASLQSAFVHIAVDKDGLTHAVKVGADNPLFVPITEIPNYLVRAVVLSEDAGFFAHRGFDLAEIKNSLLTDAEKGRAVRGGSTITQQLAKNLFLSRDKTYARKIQEALATLALESGLSKARLLEIYFNVIEWGPGIYGIGAAARHYFGKDVRELSAKEAAFLATIIPNPNRYYVYYTRGSLTELWEQRVHDLLLKMKESGALDQQNYSLAEQTPLWFARN